jgi:sugar O-acyltransferase (sialic acid O-acetyltransferase NeuD family)
MDDVGIRERTETFRRSPPREALAGAATASPTRGSGHQHADELVIIGAGGHAREVYDIARAVHGADRRLVRGFIADQPPSPDEAVLLDAPFLGGSGIIEHFDLDYVIGIGSPAVRSRFARLLTEHDRRAAVLVHPQASVGSNSELGPGVVLAPGARVTVDVRLGPHVHCNVNAVVSHDCRIGACTSISPGALLNGSVTVGERVFIGTGAIITPGRTVGDDAIIGAGAVVVDDVAPGVTVKGVPAR